MLSMQAQLEMQLSRTIEEFEKAYQVAEHVFGQHSTQGGADAEKISECLLVLSPVMKQIEHIEKRMNPLRTEWIKMKFMPSASLKRQFENYQKLLTELIGKIHFMEQQARTAQQVAGLQIDSMVKHQQMQKAYQRTQS